VGEGGKQKSRGEGLKYERSVGVAVISNGRTSEIWVQAAGVIQAVKEGSFEVE
jgi:hypothetical protein